MPALARHRPHRSLQRLHRQLRTRVPAPAARTAALRQALRLVRREPRDLLGSGRPRDGLLEPPAADSPALRGLRRHEPRHRPAGHLHQRCGHQLRQCRRLQACRPRRHQRRQALLSEGGPLRPQPPALHPRTVDCAVSRRRGREGRYAGVVRNLQVLAQQPLLLPRRPAAHPLRRRAAGIPEHLRQPREIHSNAS